MVEEKHSKPPHKCNWCPHICPGCGKEVVIVAGTSSARPDSVGRRGNARPVFCGMPSCFTKRIRQVWEERGFSVEFGTVTYHWDDARNRGDGKLLGVSPGEPNENVRTTGLVHQCTKLLSVTSSDDKTYRFDIPEFSLRALMKPDAHDELVKYLE